MRNIISIKSCTIASSLALAAAMTIGFSAQSADAATLLAQYEASNYNATTGVWTDSSGNGYTATSAGTTAPTVATGVTPNGSNAVDFSGTQWLTISNGTTGISATGNAFTVFAFVSVDSAAGSYGIVGSAKNPPNFGSNLAYSLIVAADGTFRQNASRSAEIGGHSLGVVGHASDEFVNINTAANASGATFRLNGADDTNKTEASFNDAGYPLTSLGAARPDGTAKFSGQIAEVRIYQGLLSDEDRISIESELQAAYVPEPGTMSLLVLGGMALIARRRRHA